jgi:hypothetical protein
MRRNIVAIIITLSLFTLYLLIKISLFLIYYEIHSFIITSIL